MANDRQRRDRVVTAITIAALLTIGLAVRLFFVPYEGYGFDVGVNKGWARSAAELGPAKSYSEQVGGNMLPNYPPLSVLMFAAVGHLQPYTGYGPVPSMLLIKLPAILSDLLTGLILALVALKFRGRKAAFIVAAAYAIQPAVIYDSAVWGQTDSFFTLFAVAAVASFAVGQIEAGGVFAVLCVLAKLQGIFILPLLAFACLAFPWRAVARGALAGLCAAMIVFAPFFGSGALARIKDVYIHSVGYYPNLSTGAYNLWWTLFGDSAWNKPDSDILFGFLSYRTIGLLLFGLAYALILWILRKPLLRAVLPRDRADALFLGAALAAQAFFLFNVEMHERYLFPYLALATPSMLMGAAPATLYVLGSFFFLFNLFAILQFSAIDRALYAEFPTLDVLIACGQLTVFILSLIWTTRWAWTVREKREQPFIVAWLQKRLLSIF